MATLQTEFSLEDIEIARDVLATYPCGLSRVALKAPDQVYRLGSSNITSKHKTGLARITYRTLKLQYAIEVWLRAVAISQRNPGPLLYYWWLQWENCPNGFRSIVYSDSLRYYKVNQVELIKGFINLLRDIANSGEIKIHEYCHSQLHTSFDDFCDTCEPGFEVVVEAPTAKDGEDKIGPIADYDYNKVDVSYTWNDIKDFFCLLTLNQLRLVNNKGLHKQSLWDKVLFEGANDCNVSLIQYAIDNGANVRSLDSLGDSALVSAIGNARCLDPKGCDTAKIIETLDFLLSKGADIDAFGYNGIPPLMEAYYANSVELVKFLLERDANVNFNCFLMDCQYWPTLKMVKCSLIKDIEDSIDDDPPEIIEIEKLVREAGGLSTDFTTT